MYEKLIKAHTCVLVFLVAALMSFNAGATGSQEKVTFCHKNKVTITVSQSAWFAHMSDHTAHGDYVGACVCSDADDDSDSDEHSCCYGSDEWDGSCNPCECDDCEVDMCDNDGNNKRVKSRYTDYKLLHGWVLGECSPKCEGQTEICDNKDNNCDGETDEGLDCGPVPQPEDPGTQPEDPGTTDGDTGPSDDSGSGNGGPPVINSVPTSGPTLTSNGGCSTTSNNAGGLTIFLMIGLGLVVARKKFSFVPFLVALMLIPFGAKADSIDSQAFKPSALKNKMVVTDDAKTQGEGTFSLNWMLHYQNDPLVMKDKPGGKTTSTLVEDELSLDVGFGYGITDRLDAAFEVPMILYQNGDNVSGSGVGDLRLRTRYGFYQQDHLNLSFNTTASAPTGKESGKYMGAKGFTFTPGVGASLDFGKWGTSATVGYQFAENGSVANLDLNDEITIGGGVWLEATDWLVLMTELHGSTPATDPYGTDNNSPMELDFAAKLLGTDNVALTVGFGTGLKDSYSAPDYRMFAGLSMSHTPKKAVKPAPKPVPPKPAIKQVPPPKKYLKKLRLKAALFYFDSTKFKPESMQNLEDAVVLFKDNSDISRIHIDAHCDVRGSDEYNQKLSERRAKAVAKYLVDNGVSGKKITWSGHGERHPEVKDAKTEAAHQKNRRADFVVTIYIQ